MPYFCHKDSIKEEEEKYTGIPSYAKQENMESPICLAYFSTSFLFSKKRKRREKERKKINFMCAGGLQFNAHRTRQEREREI